MIIAICLMALVAFGCEDLQQGTQGGNESENTPGTDSGNEDTGTETMKFPTLWGIGEDSKPVFDKEGTEVSTFEMMSFNIFEEDLEGIEEHCDSLVWTVKDAEGSHVIVPNNNLVGKTNEWTHYFTKAGNYETYLDAWKDNKVIKRLVFYVKVKDSGKDFLHMNWADMTRGSRKELSSALQQQSFKAFYHEDDGHPYFEITVLGVLEDQQVLYDFITGIYGAPTLTADDGTFMEYYQKYCLAKKEDESPIAIWSHDPNLVVLVSDNDEQGNPGRYLIHVERLIVIK